jgi:hypothetical protein
VEIFRINNASNVIKNEANLDMYYNASCSYRTILLADVTCIWSQVCIQGDVLSPLDIAQQTNFHPRSSETTYYRRCAFVIYSADGILF